MSEHDATPLVLFKTLKNTELGAAAVRINDDGTVSLVDVLKKVTESMMASYPRTQLGTWTPNRAAIRYTREELEGRNVRNFETGESLDFDGIAALAS